MWKILTLLIQLMLINPGFVSTLPADNTCFAGEKDANITDYPYRVVVRIEDEEGFKTCGGVILSAIYVLTSAHCIGDASEDSLSVRIGSSFKFNESAVYVVEYGHVHPDYDKKELDYNIYILKLFTRISFDSLAQPITLPRANSEIEDGLSAIGFSYKRSWPYQLQMVPLSTISTKKCRKLYPISNRMFCAEYERGGRDCCRIESGEPLVVSGVLIGIFSSGFECRGEKRPRVFTKVSKFRHFIDKIIKA